MWLCEKGYATRIEVYEKAKDLFGPVYEFFLMDALSSGSVFVMDNRYYPSEGLKKLTGMHIEDKKDD